ncbi:MAG TPA: DNA gyrase inhibitor YacG [Alphaproteobacteria bacterium]
MTEDDKLISFPARRAQRTRKKKCPICGRPPLAANDPFCSKRCADEDLRRWLTGGYRLPTRDTPESGPDDEGGGT